MYDLNLTTEQIEFRDTVRDFVDREIKPVALHPDRLQQLAPAFPQDLLDKTGQMGLRTLALSEESGGAGADNLTSCIIMEELAAGDVDVAVALAQTTMLARILFDELMTPEQRERFLPGFMADDGYHLAFAGHAAADAPGWRYHRPRGGDNGAPAIAMRHGDGWLLNGSFGFVANAPTARLIAVEATTDSGASVLLVPRDTPGLAVRELNAEGRAGEPAIKWHHGTGGGLVLKDCRVPAGNVLGRAALPEIAQQMRRSVPQQAAVNLGVGRAAYEAAVDYAKLRVQGGRRIIEHQAIGAKLADIAIKLEVARNMVWKAAWALDHPEAVAGRSLAGLPLHIIAKVFTSEAVREVTEDAAECFGAMGVMRDMPLQKYVHDAVVFLHSGTSNTVAKFEVAEVVAGFRPPAH